MIKIKPSPGFRSAVDRLRAIDGAVDTAVREGSAAAVPAWKGLVAGHASTVAEARLVASTATAVVTATGVKLDAGDGGSLRNGLSSPRDAGAVEFAGRRGGKTAYRRRSPRGKVHTVRRNTTAQLRPHNANGYVMTPAISPMMKALAKAWITAVEDATRKAPGQWLTSP